MYKLESRFKMYNDRRPDPVICLDKGVVCTSGIGNTGYRTVAVDH